MCVWEKKWVTDETRRRVRVTRESRKNGGPRAAATPTWPRCSKIRYARILDVTSRCIGARDRESVSWMVSRCDGGVSPRLAGRLRCGRKRLSLIRERRRRCNVAVNNEVFSYTRGYRDRRAYRASTVLRPLILMRLDERTRVLYCREHTGGYERDSSIRSKCEC